ncbi:cellulose binding domain-containing protein, partial [Streptomyces longispororuber]|uniref:cellulose binding domain-containing protein n=1 Tax=Streptomyces longispororuber TaxID=68230 RepID=UPI00210EB2CE
GVTGYDVVRVDGTTETTVAATTSTKVTVESLKPVTAYTFAVYAKDAAGNRSARSATVTVTTEKDTGTPGAACTVGYRVVNSWPGGFQGEIVLRNTGTATVTGWTLGFAFPDGQAISNMWGGTPTQHGTDVTVAAASYTATIPVGGTATLGFTATASAANPPPTTFTLNGTTCTSA